MSAQSRQIKKVLFVTDAWRPQINGVVRTLGRMADELPKLGVEAEFLSPDGFRTVGMPSYPSIRLAVTGPGVVARRIDDAKPDHIHIVTEGPLGWLGRRHCLRKGLPFTTNYHTKFPEYLSARTPIPESWTYALLRRFHNSGAATLVATESLRKELTACGFTHVRPWTRGVDTEHFRPDRRGDLGLPRPIFLYVGRIAVEKNLEAFLSLELPGSKALVGIGPAMEPLKAKFPDAHFLGELSNGELARTYASADVFVFPSRTDTFGIVLLEGLASGLPVAAYPVTGPVDVVKNGVTGVLSENLRDAALAALELDPADAREAALGYSWRRCAEMLLGEFQRVYAEPKAEPMTASPSPASLGKTAPIQAK